MQLTASHLIDLEILSVVAQGKLGVAVSGGSDSLALLHLAHDHLGERLHVVTVDHGLRPESKAEAQSVAKIASGLGLSHDILDWIDKPERGNLQNLARHARKRLLSDWARSKGISAIALGHTADDQAETFLMRLARGSGLQGLSAMDPMVQEDGFIWLRPLLEARRSALRGYLQSRDIEWVEDPSNADSRFDRVKMRKVINTLNKAGIEVPQIARTTKRLRSAKQVLYTSTRDLGHAIAKITPLGEIVMDWDRLISAQQSIRLRLLSEAIRTVSGSYYAPRAYAVEALMDADAALRTTLNGCMIIRDENGQLTIRREPAAVGDPVDLGKVWDDRWLVTGDVEGAHVAALGAQGLATFKDWRALGHAREALMTTPAVWRGTDLIAAPFVEKRDEIGAKLHIGNAFFTALG